MFSIMLAIIAIILLDIVLSGDNAVIIAMTANKLPEHQRSRAITIGMIVALGVRIVLCLGAAFLLAAPYVGWFLKVAGGGYLLYVAWQLYLGSDDKPGEGKSVMSWTAAIWQIVLADVSMSLDNVVAIAGIAGGSVLTIGLGLTASIIILAVFSRVLVVLMQRYAFLNVFGAITIALVGMHMLFEALIGPVGAAP